MADVRKALYGYLTGQTSVTDLIGTRLYPYGAPTSATMPYVVMSMIDATHDGHTKSATGFVRRVMQFDVIGSTGVSVESVVDALRGELDGYHGTMGDDSLETRVRLKGERDGYVPPSDATEVGTCRQTMEFSVWHRESVPTF